MKNFIDSGRRRAGCHFPSSLGNLDRCLDDWAIKERTIEGSHQTRSLVFNLFDIIEAGHVASRSRMLGCLSQMCLLGSFIPRINSS
jgi:hypothetical protein